MADGSQHNNEGERKPTHIVEAQSVKEIGLNQPPNAPLVVVHNNKSPHESQKFPLGWRSRLQKAVGLPTLPPYAREAASGQASGLGGANAWYNKTVGEGTLNNTEPQTKEGLSSPLTSLASEPSLSQHGSEITRRKLIKGALSTAAVGVVFGGVKGADMMEKAQKIQKINAREYWENHSEELSKKADQEALKRQHYKAAELSELMRNPKALVGQEVKIIGYPELISSSPQYSFWERLTKPKEENPIQNDFLIRPIDSGQGPGFEAYVVFPIKDLRANDWDNIRSPRVTREELSKVSKIPHEIYGKVVRDEESGEYKILVEAHREIPPTEK